MLQIASLTSILHRDGRPRRGLGKLIETVSLQRRSHENGQHLTAVDGDDFPTTPAVIPLVLSGYVVLDPAAIQKWSDQGPELPPVHGGRRGLRGERRSVPAHADDHRGADSRRRAVLHAGYVRAWAGTARP